ncbi:MAG TPA: class I SAM-dependent methyltransferase [Gaiellales bacterium]
MKQDERHGFVEALRRARERAYPAGEYVEQEGFMRAGEIRDLAERAGVAPGVSVLDVCCGVAGPGRFITRALGCSYLGVDSSASAIDIARARAHGLDCRFEVARVPPLPPGPFDVVLLLETMLAFPDKRTLVREIGRTLAVGGRFAFTLEAGAPLGDGERNAMPDADTVWLTPLEEVRELLGDAGLTVCWEDDHTDQHRAVAEALHDAFADDAPAIASRVGRRALDDLLRAHHLWSAWLETGRVRKIAVVAEKGVPAAASECGQPETAGSQAKRRYATTNPATPHADTTARSSAATCEPPTDGSSAYRRASARCSSGNREAMVASESGSCVVGTSTLEISSSGSRIRDATGCAAAALRTAVDTANPMLAKLAAPIATASTAAGRPALGMVAL